MIYNKTIKTLKYIIKNNYNSYLKYITIINIESIDSINLRKFNEIIFLDKDNTHFNNYYKQLINIIPKSINIIVLIYK